MSGIKQFTITTAALTILAGFGFAAGTTTADFLKVSPDSRSAALGQTGAADPDNGFAAFHNPALPAAAKAKVSVSAGQTQWILGTQVSHYEGNFRKEDRDGAWGMAVSVSQWNTPSFDTTDNLGNVTGRSAYKAQTAGVSLSRAWGENFSVGGGVKQISQGFVGQASASGQALAWDAGVFTRGGEGRWNVGLVLQNAGAAAGLDNAKDPLPTTVRAGVELRPGEKQFSWNFETAQARGSKMAFGGGLGFSALSCLTIRAGYDGMAAGPNFAGITSGLGIVIRNFSLDYSFAPFGELGNVQRISVTWAYGGTPRTEAKRVRGAARAGEINFSNRRFQR
jgi:hypothetical protein